MSKLINKLFILLFYIGRLIGCLTPIVALFIWGYLWYDGSITALISIHLLMFSIAAVVIGYLCDIAIDILGE